MWKNFIYDISYKTFTGAKPLHIDKIDGFIKICDEIRYLEIFGCWLYDETYNRIRYLICEKGGITDCIVHNFPKIKIDW